MSDIKLSNSAIIAAYRQRTPRSAALAEEALALLPSGVTHDSRYQKPYGIYVERAAGPRKWDVDGNEYVDYFGGHGALLLGHNHPSVFTAMQEALARGTHFGANHEIEVRWATLVRRLVPSAERVRFTASGTEATLMALRLARAFTGRPKIVRFLTHFHGWHDHMTAGHQSHFDGSPTAGVVAGIANDMILLPPGDVAAMRSVVESRDDIAAAIIEPTGSSFGAVPLKPDFLAALREATAKCGAMLIFDEVVTGFRVSKRGAQGAFGITPDLTALAKILAGACQEARSAAAKRFSTSSISRLPKNLVGKKLPTREHTTRTRSRQRQVRQRSPSSALRIPRKRQTATPQSSADSSTISSPRNAFPGQYTAPSADSTCSSIQGSARSRRRALTLSRSHFRRLRRSQRRSPRSCASLCSTMVWTSMAD